MVEHRFIYLLEPKQTAEHENVHDIIFDTLWRARLLIKRSDIFLSFGQQKGKTSPYVSMIGFSISDIASKAILAIDFCRRMFDN